MQVRKGKVHDARSFGGRIQGRIVRALALQILQSGCRREDLAKVLVPDKAIKIANGGGIFRRHAFWQTLGIDQGGGRRERRKYKAFATNVADGNEEREQEEVVAGEANTLRHHPVPESAGATHTRGSS